MNVTIQQRRFTLRSEYDISGPGFKYYAKKKLFEFFARLRLVALDGRELAKLKKLPSLFKARFEFQLSDGRVYQFRCEKFWKGVFLCQGDADSEGCRSAFRTDVDHHSEVMPISVPN